MGGTGSFSVLHPGKKQGQQSLPLFLFAAPKK
jgi:hypothetical protein